ncbi:hypothetical protein ACFLU6_13505 [Acidobacteriota bacterium]
MNARTALLAIAVFILLGPALGECDDIMLFAEKGSGNPPAVLLQWDFLYPYPSFWVWRDSDPIEISTTGQLLTVTDQLSFQDSFAPLVAYYFIEGGCLDDHLEDNDTPMDATPAMGTGYDHLQICSLDEDWFSFDLHCGATLFVEIKFSHYEGDLDLELWDCNLAFPIETASSRTDNEYLSWGNNTIGSNEIFFLRIYGVNGAENVYDARFYLSEYPVITYDLIEPNDSPAEASPGWPTVPSLDGMTIVALDVEDWYTEELVAGQTFDAEMRVYYCYSAYKLKMELIDVDGVTVLARSMSAILEENLSCTVPATGSYYLRVFPESAGNHNIYALSVTAN